MTPTTLAAALTALSEQVAELTALVSASEAERYRSCGELMLRAEAAEAKVARLDSILSTIVSRCDTAKQQCAEGAPVSAFNLASAILGQIGGYRDALPAPGELEICGKCMGSGYGGHPDSGSICADCNGSGGIAALPPADDAVEAHDEQLGVWADELMADLVLNDLMDLVDHEYDTKVGARRTIIAALEPAPDMAELVEAHRENARVLSHLHNDLQGRVDAAKLAALFECLARSTAALAKIKEPQHG